MQEEIWEPITVNEEIWDYEVSNLGRVRNSKTGRVMKLQETNKGYLRVCLRKNGESKQFSVHRLVAFAFIPNDDTENKTDVNHIDEDKTNNTVENLEWCTREYNINYGTHNERVAKTLSKKIIGKSLAENKIIIFQSMCHAERCGFDKGAISRCCNGKQKYYKGFMWSCA